MLLGYDYHNGNTYKHGNSYLLWEVDKDNIANQSAISLIIRATGICWNQMVCKGMARNKGILLKKLLETIHIYFRARTDYSKNSVMSMHMKSYFV